MLNEKLAILANLGVLLWCLWPSNAAADGVDAKACIDRALNLEEGYRCIDESLSEMRAPDLDQVAWDSQKAIAREVLRRYLELKLKKALQANDIRTWTADGPIGSKVIWWENRSKTVYYRLVHLLIYDCENLMVAQCGVVLSDWNLPPETSASFAVLPDDEKKPFSFKFEIQADAVN